MAELNDLFPLEGLVPKSELQVTSFLDKYPNYDGRSIIVAVFDTGIDLGSPGLNHLTTDGKPKILDAIDCTGSGDVDTSTIVNISLNVSNTKASSTTTVDEHHLLSDSLPNEDEEEDLQEEDVNKEKNTINEKLKNKKNILIGKSGRKLLIPSSWQELNPSGIYHLGLKNLFELYPSTLLERIKKERKSQFEKIQLEKVKELKEKLNNISLKNHDENKKIQQALEKQLELLNDLLTKQFEDTGPSFDCIVFKDVKNEIWRACIVSKFYSFEKELLKRKQQQEYKNDDDEEEFKAENKAEKNEEKNKADKEINEEINEEDEEEDVIDLEKEVLLCDYRLEYKYDTFSEEDLLNYSVNIYDDGNVLSIVVPSGGHGTHVAGIIGAYFPENPELNGVAPGCQLISIKIGDTRLGTMETGTGLLRGLNACYQHKAHLVNMSYGEPASLTGIGRFKEKLEELVYKHNVCFLTSAGNAGPNFSTIGAPASLTDACISVGAYVSKSMMKAQYSLIDDVPESQFTWSSRGPSLDGANVTISGLGAAISSSTNYSLQKLIRMNGTSMSCPNVCGGLALILSGMKQSNLDWNFYYIKQVIQNTAYATFNQPLSLQQPLQSFYNNNRKRQVEEPIKKHQMHPLSVGSGLLQVLNSFHYILKHPFNPETDNYRYEIEITQKNNARGIYLREYEETHRGPQTFTVNVKVKFHEDFKNFKKLNYEKKLKLVPILYNIPADNIIDDNHYNNHYKNVYNGDYNNNVIDASDVIKVTEFIHIPGTNTFNTIIDTTNLFENQIYFGKIEAYDCNDLSLGPVFFIPITIIKPIKFSELNFTTINNNFNNFNNNNGIVNSHNFNNNFKNNIVHKNNIVKDYNKLTSNNYLQRFNYTLKSGELKRLFITPPSCNVQYCKVTFHCHQMSDNGPKTLILHTTQLLEKESYSLLNNCKFISLSESDKNIQHFKTIPNRTLELTIGQFWSSVGEITNLEIDIEFCGFECLSSTVPLQCDERLASRNDAGGILFDGNEQCKKIILQNVLKNEDLNLNCQLNTWREILQPINTTTNNDNNSLQNNLQLQKGERNSFFNSGKSTYQLILEYQLKITTPTTNSATEEITIRAPIISSLLYESDLESQMIMIFNSNKKLIKVLDFHETKIKLKKDTYICRLQLRHDNLLILQKLQNYPLTVDHVLSKPLSLKLYKNVNGAFTDEYKLNEKLKLVAGRTEAFVLGFAPSGQATVPEIGKDLPKEVKPGDLLYGKLQYKKAPDCANIPLTFVIPPNLLSKSSNNNNNSENNDNKKKITKTEEEKFKEFLFEQQLNYLKKLKKNNERLNLLEQVILNNNNLNNINNLSLLELKLNYLFEDLKDQFKNLQNTLQNTLQKEEEYKNNLEKIKILIDEILNQIDINEICFYIATQPKNKLKNQLEENCDNNTIVKCENDVKKDDKNNENDDKTIEKKKEILINTLIIKLDIYLNYSSLPNKEEYLKENHKENKELPNKEFKKENDLKIKQIMKQLRQWIDPTEKCLLLDLQYDLYFKHFEFAFSKIIKKLEENNNLNNNNLNLELYKLQLKILKQFGWIHWIVMLKENRLVKMKEEYPLF
ncbi:hypothetical protein ABK040_009934 [Willaertia magna]